MAKFAKNDMRYYVLRDHLLKNDVDPNIFLISGMNNDLGDRAAKDAPDLIDLPFPCCVLEATDGNLFNIPTKGDELKGESPFVQTILVCEIGPEYHFLVMLESGGMTWSCIHDNDTNAFYRIIMEDFCKFINSKKTKIGSSKTRVRYKHPKHGLRKIKRLIQVVPLSLAKKTNSINGMNVDWSHRWEVSGHWRSLGDPKKIGKDRRGEYIIKGSTWIAAHVRGPDDKDLVKKVRLKND